jgi:hypothetical protein
MEWVYAPVTIKAGGKWTTKYYFCIAKGIDEIAFASSSLAAGYSWESKNLEVQIAPVLTMQKHKISSMELNSIYGKTWEEYVDLVPGTSFKFILKDLITKLPGASSLKFSVGNTGFIFYLSYPQNSSSAPLPQIATDAHMRYKTIKATKHDALDCGTLGEGISVWQAIPLEKIFKEDEFLPVNTLPPQVAARRERESYLFVFQNKAQKKINLTCRIEAFVHEYDKSSTFNAEIPARVGYITTETPTNMKTDYPVGDFPDPLIPGNEFKVNPKENLSLWLTVKIPENARSGIYKSNLKLRAENGIEKTIPLSLEVKDFELPLSSKFRTTYGCWVPCRKILDEVGFKGRSAEFAELLQDNYFEHRFTPREISVNLCGEKLEEISRKMKTYIEKGITSLRIPSNCPPGKIKHILRILEELQFKGDAYVYMIDEAPANYYPQVREDCKKFKKISSLLKTLATIYGPEPEALFGYLDIWCRPISTDPWIKKRIAAGDEFWTSNGGLTAVEDTLLKQRLSYWKHKACGYTGDLIWNCIAGYGKENPWENIYCAGMNGNAHLLYPAANGPISSIRWESLAESLEDYDYFCILEGLLKNCHDKKVNPKKLENAEALLKKIHNMDFISGLKTSELLDFKNKTATEIVFLKNLLLPECADTSSYPRPPKPPLEFPAVPENGIRVNSTTSLSDVLKQKIPQTIILEPGIYENNNYLSLNAGHKLFAAKTGTVIIRFGFSVGSNSMLIDGAVFSGLKFDIENKKYCKEGACILTWGKSRNTTIEDCVFNGNKCAATAIMARQPDGLILRRMIIRDMVLNGILVMNYKIKDAGTTAVLEDIDVDGVSCEKAKSSDGTAEAGLWLGNTCCVKRVKVRNCAWMGIWTGNYCFDSLIEDFDIDDTPVGIYMEHDSENNIFQRFKIGPDVKTGINCEWGKHCGVTGASVNNLIQNGIVSAASKGIYMDECSVGTYVRNVLVKDASWGGIGMYKSPTCNVLDGCRFELPEGTEKIRYNHWSK